MFTAVNAINGDYEPYIDTVSAAPGASADAAAVAAYKVLSIYFGSNPAVLAMLNSSRTASLAAIPDGPAKNAGIETGEAAASAIMALRANDGSTPAQFYTPPPAAPGEWVATPSCPVVGGVQVGAFLHWRNVAPFGVQFAPFIATPCFPSYPSNHASGSTAAAEMLRRLYGAAGFAIELTSPNPALAGITLQYSQLREMISDVSDARVYGGIHFRFDQNAGERLGREVATFVYKDNLRPIHGPE